MPAFSIILISKNAYGPQMKPITLMGGYYAVIMPTWLEKVKSDNRVMNGIVVISNMLFLKITLDIYVSISTPNLGSHALAIWHNAIVTQTKDKRAILGVCVCVCVYANLFSENH